MSLYHETASILSADASNGGNLRSRVFNKTDLKSPPTQVYALALETCKWSPFLSEIIDHSQLLQHEKKVNDYLFLERHKIMKLIYSISLHLSSRSCWCMIFCWQRAALPCQLHMV